MYRSVTFLLGMKAVNILEVDDTIRKYLMAILDDKHDWYLHNLSSIKLLTPNLISYADIIHATELHFTHQQTIPIF